MRKLTDSDKEEILKLYRQTAETTSTLAERYDVSNSTISRLLKSTLPEDEYEYLVSLKRAARTPEGRAQVTYENPPLFTQVELEAKEQELPQQKPPLEEEFSPVTATEPIPKSRRVKRRSSATEEVTPSVAEQLELLPKTQEITNIPSPLIEDKHPNAQAIAQILGEDLLDESEELEDLDEDLDEEDFDDEDFDDEEDFVEAPRLVTRARIGDSFVRVLPLSAANLPKTCYLVIDRSSELITRPLRDFGDLGHIPSPETQERTLPVFDNHRVAKRFSTKRDRVVKIPDSKMLHKARYQLQAKGITRLLIDGQVYSLSSV
ncbi:transposase [Chlorogloeopsis sp. ULAP01]|uniref:transposase n=1 Tax=Chlorogloeopsis sp. ULAP01 TaxID=3056483 RepID=UPI0025AA4F22|nr:transposase [Chlorogloeopsis sp. ULAP01]MDM9383127.1 transposase [Chlorogloeopsis sp. ULAP01]